MLITNFASGELSDKLSGRVDLQQYFQGAGYIENFEIQPTGGVYRRAGFKHILKLHGICRLIPFIVDKDNSFILEFTPKPIATEAQPNPTGHIYIYKIDNKNKTYSDVTGNTEIKTDYANIDEINEIQYAQDYDRMIFVQSQHPPIVFKYDITNKTFTKGSLNFDFSPTIKIDDDYKDTTSPIYYKITEGIIDDNITTDEAEKAGKKYLLQYGRLIHKEGNTWKDSETGVASVITSSSDARATGYQEEKIFRKEGYYPRAVAFFNSRLWLAGGNSEIQKVYASKAPDTNKVRYNDFSTYEKNVTVDKSLGSGNELFTFTADVEYSTGATKFVNVSQDFTDGGKKEKGKYKSLWQKKEDNNYKYTDYYIYNPSYVPAGARIISISKDVIEIDKNIFGFPKTKVVTTDNNGKGEITEVTDNITAKTFTITKWEDPMTPNTSDYEMQVVSQNIVTADCSFSFEVASDQNDAIKWLSGGNVLSIGTESGVWTVPATVNALNIQATNDSRNGSDDIQAHKVDNATIYFAQGKHGIREHYFNTETQGFITNNIALFAEHLLTESPAVDFDFLTNPYNRIVITREDGAIVSMLYDKTNGVMAWNRTTHGGNGKFTSCATIRGDKDSDLLFQAVKDNGNYYLEMLDPNEKIYLDSYQELSATEIENNHISKVKDDYNSDAIVIINYADGTQDIKTKDEAAAPNGLTLVTGDKAYIGYNYPSKIESLPIVAGEPSGKKRIVNLLVRFNKSYFPTMQCDDKKEYFLDAEEPFSGYKYIDYSQNTERDVNFTLTFEKPLPCNILCIQANLA